MGVYTRNFNWTNWQDVCNGFDMNEPQPDEVLAAYYAGVDYDGSAFVVYRNGDKYYTVSGSHCSCYGLEGQWAPEEYTREQLIAALEKGWKDEVTTRVLAQLKAD